jgi:hypothetical protein
LQIEGFSINAPNLLLQLQRLRRNGICWLKHAI